MLHVLVEVQELNMAYPKIEDGDKSIDSYVSVQIYNAQTKDIQITSMVKPASKAGRGLLVSS